MNETAAILNGATRALAGAARRDRPRHLHLGRPERRHGGDRVPARPDRAPRRSSPRTTTSSRASRSGWTAVVNFSVAVKEEGEHIVFLRSLVPGGADRSYGVEVARLAGLPHEVIERARALLRELERGGGAGGRRPTGGAPRPEPDQLALFAAAPTPRARTACAAVDADALTPVQALSPLAELAAARRAAEPLPDAATRATALDRCCALLPLLLPLACGKAGPDTPPRQKAGSPFHYPEDLWDAGVEGETLLRIFVTRDGRRRLRPGGEEQRLPGLRLRRRRGRPRAPLRARAPRRGADRRLGAAPRAVRPARRRQRTAGGTP